jgi:hypothetical protein
MKRGLTSDFVRGGMLPFTYATDGLCTLTLAPELMSKG